ncbi:MAG: hypothetical protein QXN71_03545 [Candidatus Aenigmatarchaeota archaeon]
MGNYSYITNRTLQNSKGEERGRISVLVRVGSTTAEYKYVCPECGDQRSGEQEFRRPLMVKCKKCGFLMKLPRLKDEIKRDKKRFKSCL